MIPNIYSPDENATAYYVLCANNRNFIKWELKETKPGLQQRLITPTLNSHTVPGCHRLRTTEHRNSVWPKSSALYCSIHLRQHNDISSERRNTADRSGTTTQQNVVGVWNVALYCSMREKKFKNCNRICAEFGVKNILTEMKHGLVITVLFLCLSIKAPETEGRK